MITHKDLRFLKVAKAISETSTYPRVKIGACVVKKSKVVSVGCNSLKSHPVQLKYNKFLPYSVNVPRLHAEIDALVKCHEDVKGGTIYIFRMGRDGVTRLCKPCESCRNFIIDKRIRRIVWTDTNGIMEEKLY